MCVCVCVRFFSFGIEKLPSYKLRIRQYRTFGDQFLRACLGLTGQPR